MRLGPPALALALAVTLATAAGGQSTPASSPLDTPVSLSFEGAPLDVVLDGLRESARVNIVLHPEARETSPDSNPVTARLDGVPLRTALRVVLRPSGLTFEAVAGVVLVVPQRLVDAQTCFRMYDVRDLLAAVRDFEGPELSLASKSTVFG